MGKLLSSGEGPTENSVGLGKTKRDQGIVNPMKKNLLWQFYISPIESNTLMYPPVSKKPEKLMWKTTWYIDVQDTLLLLDYFPYFGG